MDICYLDLETRSKCDLKKFGLYNYAAHPSTMILIASYALNGGPIKRVMPGTPVAADLLKMLRNPKVQVRAHNAAFERLLLKHCWKIDIPLERWYCTSMQARACALPAALDNLAIFLQQKQRKNPEGYALIRLLSMPQIDGSFCNDIDAMERFGYYCDDDVRTMRECSTSIPELTDEAQQVWRANEIVNERGLPIDFALCELAMYYAEAEKEEADARIRTMSGKALWSSRGTAFTQWIYERVEGEAKTLMECERKGKKSLTLAVDTRSALLTMAEESPGSIDPLVVTMLEAADDAASSSVAKFQRMRDIASPDGRLRGAFIANGASGTGRFSSTGAQLHNFPRVTPADPEAVMQAIRHNARLPGGVQETLKSMLRSAICPGEGRVIVRGDWNAVEARALPWLTARASAAIYLDAFTDPDRDIYVEQAQKAGLGDNRQAGKVVVLSLGYGGGAGALTAMAKNYSVTIADKDGVKSRWRNANRWAPEWWYELEDAAKRGIRHNETFDCGRATVSGADDKLRITLPSGRILNYPYANVIPTERDCEVRYAKAAWKPKAGVEEWPTAALWGGLCAENITQAACADLLRHALVQGVKDGLPIIGHVHDELICEGDGWEAKDLALQIEKTMLDSPAWASGLPLAVETDSSPRFRK